MAEIADIAAYFCENYPHKSELSKTRLTKLVYLADWEFAKMEGRQMTPIRWYFHNFGPYVDDVIESVSSDSRFVVKEVKNAYGDSKLEIHLRNVDRPAYKLADREIEVLNDVISRTSTMYWNAFIKHVYETPPIANSDRYNYLDLNNFAVEA
ncbi:Panacea domain-containing protein [Oceaniglobus ichthyenteri]|uniref:Panacea domain-containing protein n=1 Tax=Oceaniglobus ichthyenteri TaxID=2136177 RepID=UPI000D34FC00|nr:Panacea domain-containing protein [Oceaniglobus ichthyenteri]